MSRTKVTPSMRSGKITSSGGFSIFRTKIACEWSLGLRVKYFKHSSINTSFIGHCIGQSKWGSKCGISKYWWKIKRKVSPVWGWSYAISTLTVQYVSSLISGSYQNTRTGLWKFWKIKAGIPNTQVSACESNYNVDSNLEVMAVALTQKEPILMVHT